MEDCPLPELYHKAQEASPGLSIGRFHDGLRKLHAQEQITNPQSPLQEPGMPMSADAKPAPDTSRRSLKVELPGEGVYGLYLVVKSGVGRGKTGPKNGDMPQMRIEVDTTPP